MNDANKILSGIPGAQVSRQVPVVLPAATLVNGQVQPAETFIAQAGNLFYVLAASASVQIQPVRAGAIGASNNFSTAQGQPVSGGFDTLTVRNLSLFPVVASIWVGYDSFINDQVTITNNAFFDVAYPTYPTPNAASTLEIPDLTGQTFTDANGNKWGAVTRKSILVFNLDGGVTMLLQKKGAATSSGPAVGAIYPLTPIRFDFGGDYSINIGGGNINAVVSEIYTSIALTS